MAHDEETEKTLQALFTRRILGCLSSTKHTVEEIRSVYLKQFPQGRIMKVLVPAKTPGEVRHALQDLVTLGMAVKEITRFTDQVLDRDTEVFSLTDKGSRFLLKKGGKIK